MSNIVSIHGYDIHYHNGEPTIRDLDLAKRLGYGKPYDIRQLIVRIMKNGQIKPGQVFSRQVKHGAGGRPGVEFFLSPRACLAVVMATETKGACAAKSELLDLFTDAESILKAIRNFEVPDDLPDMYVYAIREKDTGHIKLGISRDPERRLKDLQTANSSELELVAYRKADNRFADERAIHADADAYRLRGEWFTASALEVLQ